MKKTLKTLLTLIIGANMLIAGNALTLDGAETANLAGTAELAATAVSTANIVPGKNIFTGTTGALTFSDASAADYFTITGMTPSVVETSKIYGTNNSAFQFACPKQAGTAYYPKIVANFDTAINRPVALLFDLHDAYLAFSWSAGKTGYISGGYDNGKNFNVRKTNIANVAPLNDLTIGCVVVASTWETYYNYMDNLAVIPYYQVTYDMPAGKEDVIKYVLADDDGSGNIALEMTSDGVISGFATSYTVDDSIVADGGENATFLGWALEDAPATAVTSVALANEDIVLVPVFEGEVEELVTYNEQYGEMIFSSDLEGNTYNITNATILGILSGGDNVAVEYDGNTGYRGYGLTEGYFYSKVWAEGGGFEFAVPGYGTAIRYNEGADVLGTVTIVFNAYNEGTADASWYDYFKQPAQTSGFAWADLRSAYSCGTAPVGGWNEVVYSNKYIGTPATIIGLSQKNRRDVVYGDIAVYVKPSNALWLTDSNGENRKFEIVSGTSYTLPESFRGIEVSSWTDGENVYEAGSAAALASIAGKTLSPAATAGAPDTLDVASIRTTGKQGIRFAAFIDDSRRAFADSYGFIVANASSLESDENLVFNENADASGTNEYGVRYVSGVAYDKSTGVDRVYTTDGAVFGDKGLGEGTYFTAVLHGIPEASYKTELTMRPYLVSGGNIYYGNAITRSIYEVACDLRDNGYKGLDEAGRAYIDSIIATAEK